MAQAVIQEIVGEMFDALVDAGLADAGIYTPPGGSPLACQVVIRRRQLPQGSYGSVPGNHTLLTLKLSEIPVPVRDATIIADSQTFTLVKFVEQTDATATWEVK